ncbi:antitoxin Xre/MbcA/ParS toxin-binding domain-containing protein [Pseudomonas sp. GCM10022186]|uniref:antitoxin Xre/MbcA/ParS toxin-binding domain-containing protein n=1 Tax=Pseudomonas sp. GCM10022186 TaxID=3252650 RepID=UPI0036229C9F
MPTAAQSDQRLPTADPLELLIGRERIGNPLEIFQLIETGIPITNAVRALSELDLMGNQQVLSKIIGMSQRALLRRAQFADKALNPTLSSRLLTFVKILRQAELVFGTRQRATKWITEPALGLEKYPPIDLLTNPQGAEIVWDFLARIEYGVYQ